MTDQEGTGRALTFFIGAAAGIVASFFLVVLSEDPHENPPIDLVSATILFDDGVEYSTPSNMRYKSKYRYERPELYAGWTPFIQRGKIREDTYYVFCMEDEEGNTYTSEVDTEGKEVFIVPKACPTDGTCTLNKDCR